MDVVKVDNSGQQGYQQRQDVMYIHISGVDASLQR